MALYIKLKIAIKVSFSYKFFRINNLVVIMAANRQNL